MAVTNSYTSGAGSGGGGFTTSRYMAFLKRQAQLKANQLLRDRQTANSTGAQQGFGMNSVFGPASTSPATGDTVYTTQPFGDATTNSGRDSSGSTGNAGSNPLEKSRTGSAKQYIPGADPILYDDPRILVRDTLKKMGYDTDSGVMDLIGQDADLLPYLAMLALGSGPGSQNSQDNNSVFNYGSQWAANQATPGGATLDPRAAMDAILNADPTSALGAALTGGTSQQQAATINQMLQAASMNMSPLMQQALSRHMQDQTDDALSAQAHGYKGTLQDWLRSNGGFYGS